MADTVEILVELNHNVEEFKNAINSLTTYLKNSQRNVDLLTGSTDRFADTQERASDLVDEYEGTLRRTDGSIKKVAETTGGLIGKIGGLVKELGVGQLAFIGIGGGIFNMINTAHSLNMEMSRLGDGLTRLTDSTGSVAAATQTLYAAWGNSLGSLDQIQSAMGALAESGVQLGETFTDLAGFTASLNQMTGIGAETWASFLGTIQVSFGSTINQLRELTSAIIATGLNGAELDTVLKNVQEGIKNVGYLSGDGQQAVLSLTRSIGRASAVFKKMGIDAQQAGNFINGMLNPENFERNLQLFGRLGLSTQDYLNALSSGQGQESFVDRMLENLPQLAQELQSIPDPLQRFNLLKDMGLDPEIAAKFAQSTAGEIGDIVDQIRNAQEEQEALERKEEQAKANAQRFDDALTMLKMKALLPLMNFVNAMMGPWMSTLSSLAGSVSKILEKILGIVGPAFLEFSNGLAGAAAAFESGSWDEFGKKLDEAISRLMVQIQPMLTQLIKTFAPILLTVLKEVFMAGIKGLWELFKSSPTLGTAAAVGAARSGPGRLATGAVTGTARAGYGLVQGFRGGTAAANVARSSSIITRTAGSIGARIGASGIGPALGNIAPALGNIAKVAGPVGLAIAALMGGIQALGHSADYFTESMNEANRANVEFSNTFADYFEENFDADRLDELAAKRGALTDAENAELENLERLQRIKDQTESERNTSTTVGQDASSFAAGALILGPLIDTILGWFGVDSGVTKAIAQFIYYLSNLYDSFLEFIGPFKWFLGPFTQIPAIIKLVTDNWDSLMDKFEVVKFRFRQFGEWLVKMWDRFTTNIVNSFNMIVNFIKDMWDKLMGVVFSAANVLIGAFRGITNFLGIGSIISKIWGYVSDFFGWLVQGFQKMISFVKSLFVDEEMERIARIARNSIQQIQESRDEARLMQLAQTGGRNAEIITATANRSGDEDQIRFAREQTEEIKKAAQARLERLRMERQMAAEQARTNQMLGGIGGNVGAIRDNMEEDEGPQEISLEAFTIFGAAKISDL